MKFYTSVGKVLKVKVQKFWEILPTFQVTGEKLVRETFCHPPLPILNRVKGHKLPFWISVNLSDVFKTQMKQKKHSFCVNISRREKDGVQSVNSCVVYLIMADTSFS